MSKQHDYSGIRITVLSMTYKYFLIIVSNFEEDNLAAAAVCCGVRDTALVLHTGVRRF